MIAATHGDTRRTLLERCFASEAAAERLAALIDGASPRDKLRLSMHAPVYQRELAALVAEYRDGVPLVDVSRCPHTTAVLRRAIDTRGLDGLWWRYYRPVRPVEARADTLFAFTGALRITGPVEDAPFLALPGPAVPYVIPRLLADDGVTAVVSTVAVGTHTGYVTAYFARGVPTYRRANDWGASQYTVWREDGSTGWGSVDEDAAEYDFDLGRWIEQRRVRWIAPGDAGLVLRDGTAGCPYLDLDGTQATQHVQYGRVW